MRLRGLLVVLALLGSVAIVVGVASASPTGPTAAMVSLPGQIAPGSDVALDCSPSDDGAGSIVSCAWTVDGTPVGTGDPATPVHWAATGLGDHTIGLTVTDDEASPQSDTLTVTVLVNSTPVIDSANVSDSTPTVGSPVTLSVTAHDPDGDPLDYSWTILSAPSGSASTLSDPSATSTSITPDVAGQYEFRISVADQSSWAGTELFFTAQAPASAAASAGFNDITYYRPDASVDSVGASDSVPLTLGWWAYIFNRTAVPLDDPTISVDGSSQTFTPSVSFPHTEGPGSSLGNHGSFAMTALDGAQGDAGVSTSGSLGFDASRSTDTTTIPPGGGDVTLTVNLTPQSFPAYAATIGVDFSNDPAVTVTGITGPAADPDAAADSSFDGTTASWASAVNGGTTYTTTFDLHVDNATGADETFKPGAYVQLQSAPQLLGSGGTGSSTTISDSLFGGTGTFSTTTPDVTWQQRYDIAYSEVDFAEQAPAQAQANPQALAQDQKIENLPWLPSVDSISAGDTDDNGTIGWRGEIDNFTTALVPSPAISLDGTARSFSPDPGGFPLTASGGDLGQGQNLRLDQISAGGPGTSADYSHISSGYDASRTFSTTSIPPGGTTQHVTVSITPQDSSFAGGSLSIEVEPNPDGGPAVAAIDTNSIEYPALTTETDAGAPPPNANDVQWNIDGAIVGHAYTLALDVVVPNGGSSSFTYKPFVVVRAGHSSQLPNDPGTTSTTIDDPDEGGTFTFSSTSAVDWSRVQSTEVSSYFSAIYAPPFSGSVDQPTVAAHAGSTVNETVTVTPTNGFSGAVNVNLSGAPDGSGNPTSTPGGIYQSGHWDTLNVGPGSASEPTPIQVDSSVAPGDYTVYLALSSFGEATQFVPVTITVTAALPQAQARDTRETDLITPSGLDAIGAGDQYDANRNWRISIQNTGSSTVTGAQIHLGSATADWSPSSFVPAFPQDAGPQDLAPFGNLDLTGLECCTNGQLPIVDVPDATSGFDAQRSTLSGNWDITSGGTQTAVVTVTPQVSGDLEIDFQPEDGSNHAYGSVDTADVQRSAVDDNGQGDYTQGYNATSDFVFWRIGSAQVGKTYTLTVPIDTTTDGVGKPRVGIALSAYPQTQPQPDPSTDTATSIQDDELGGTIDYSTSSSVSWQRVTEDRTNVTFQGVSPAPWTLAIDQPAVTVPAGASFDENVTITPVGGASGSVTCYMSSTPDNWYWNGDPNVSFGPDAGHTTISEQTDNGTAPGTYHLSVACNSTDGYWQYADVDVTLTPPVPFAYANDERYQNVQFDPSVDAVGATDSNQGSETWRGDISNNGSLVLPAPQISLSGYDHGAWNFTPDPGAGPFTAGPGPDLNQYDGFELDTLNGWDNNTQQPSSSIEDTPVVTGYDASRSFPNGTTIPTGGGQEDVVVTVTPQDGSLSGGWISVGVATDWYSDTSGQIDPNSVTVSSLTDGEFGGTPNFNDPSEMNVYIGNVTVGQTYTVSFTVDVANDGPPVEYKPEIGIGVGSQTLLGQVVGTSASIPDAVLGGTFSYSSSADVAWQRQIQSSVNTEFQPLTVPEYTTSLDQSELTIQQGQSANVNLTLTPVNGFAGDVSLSLAGSNAPNPWAPPPHGVDLSGDWSDLTLDGSDPATRTLGISIAGDTQPGTYTVYVDTYAFSHGPAQFTPITLTVTAAPPTAHVGLGPISTITLPNTVDALGATTPKQNVRTWFAYILDLGGTTIPAPSITYQGTTLTFKPARTFPLTETGPDLTSFGSVLESTALDGQPGDSSAKSSGTAGFDVSRTGAPAAIQPGGGVQNVSVSVTPRDPSFNSAYIDVQPAKLLPGATIVPGSVVSPTSGDDVTLAPDGTDLTWAALITTGQTYTLTFQVTVPNGGATALIYKPWVEAGVDGFHELGPDTGSATTLNDGVLGGDVTFSAGASVHWTARHLQPENDVILSAQADPQLVVPDHFTVTAPAQVVAGTPFSVRATAYDASGTKLTGYSGPVSLDDGTHTLQVTGLSCASGACSATVTVPGAAPSDTITVTDGGSSASGTSAPFAVAGPPTRFLVKIAPHTLPAGSNLVVTVTALDANGNPAAAYSGPVSFADSSGPLVGTTVSPWTNGVAKYDIEPPTPDPADVVTVDDASGLGPAVTGQSPSFVVSGPATHFAVSLGATRAAPGAPVAVTVTALDSSGSVATDYAGGPGFALSDENAPSQLEWTPGSDVWSHGIGTITVAFAQAGSDAVTATDGAIAGTSPLITIYGTLDHFAVTAPASLPAGGTGTLTVVAKDGDNQTIADYAGPVAVAENGPGGLSFSGPWTWKNGVGHVSFSFSTPVAADTLTATDASGASDPAATGTSASIVVYGAPASFTVTVKPATAPVGSALSFTAVAKDALGSVVANYDGTATATYADNLGPVSPSGVSWTNGTGKGTLTVAAPVKADVLTVADGPASGSSKAFNAVGPATHFTVTAAPTTLKRGGQLTVTVTALDAVDNTVTSYAGPVTFADLGGTATVTVVSQAWAGGVDRAVLTVSDAPRSADSITVADASDSSVSGSSNTFTAK
ncbi:MAG TPA: hypothetical protein VHD91_09830 [Gaiellaceae bacterium]|nr:hypothetical protein [Gaiellaceae bacterium]